jgi:hypothetical protein
MSQTADAPADTLLTDRALAPSHPNATPPQRPHTGGGRVRRVLLEGAMILTSVLLAFALDEYRDNRANRELARRALAAIAAEIEHNQTALAPYVTTHAAWRDALEKARAEGGNGAGLDVWFTTRPPLEGRTPFPVLRRNAWDAGVSSGAMRFIDFDVGSALADVYGMQELATANVQRLASGPLASTATYDPAQRNPSVRLLWLTLADIQAAEFTLQDLYQSHLPAIRAAASR